MRKMILSLLAMLLAVVFAACAPVVKEEGPARIKCPACGYEFEAPR